MKGFLIFCVVVVVTGLLALTLPYLKDRDRKHEERLVGALNSAEEAIETTLDRRARLYQPSMARGAQRGHWVVSGIMVSQEGLTGTASAPFSAVLESVCPESAKPSCWRVIDLAVDGRKIETVRLAGTAPATGTQGAAAAGDDGGKNGDATAAPQSTEPTASETPAAAAEPFGTSPGLAVDPVKAAAESPLPATPVAAQVSAGPDTGGDAVPKTSGDPVLSRPELTRYIQDALKRLNYEPGPTDGKLGPQTANAIRAYQSDFRLAPDGRPSIELLRHLRDRLDDLEQQSRDPSTNGNQPSG